MPYKDPDALRKRRDTDEYRAYKREMYHKKHKYQQQRHHLRRYGLTADAWKAMLDSQGGVCATCKKSPEEDNVKFQVDHDHACCPTRNTCGKCIRGIICNKCNKALGLIKDNPDTLRAMLAYLEGVSNEHI